MEVPVPQSAAALFAPQPALIRDEDIKLGDNEILARGANDVIFRTYKPIQVINYHSSSKNLGWTVNTDFRTNAQATSSAESIIFTMEVYESSTKQLKYQQKVAVANKVQGRMRAAICILIKIFGKDKKWLELVEETRQGIEDARQRRGAPERPIFKKQEDYLQESREAQ